MLQVALCDCTFLLVLCHGPTYKRSSVVELDFWSFSHALVCFPLAMMKHQGQSSSGNRFILAYRL